MRFLLSIVLSLVAHVFLGWSWSVIGGITCGYWLSSKEGVGAALVTGLMGALCVGMSWAILVGYNMVQAQAEVRTMLEIMGGILGNLPGSVIVVLTIFIGAVLGMLGALIGNQARRIRESS